VFNDNFNAVRNYRTKGPGVYAGILNGTIDVLDADTTRSGALYMQTTGAFGDPGPGPMLYVEVIGDFTATVKVVDFAGTLAAPILHNDSGIVARDPASAPGMENWVSVNYFPTWTAFIARSTINSARAGLGATTGIWTGDDTFAIVARYPWIQLERKGANFYFRISADGKTFIPLTDPGYQGIYNGSQTPLVVSRPDLPSTLQVGLMNATYNVTTGYVAFDDFRVEGPNVIPAGPMAYDPDPADQATDLPPDEVLSWTPAQGIGRHDVYVGTNFDDVSSASRINPKDVLVSRGLDANTLDLAGLLDVRKTYYWRVDEIEADGTTIHPGDIWSFSTYNFDPQSDAVYTTDEDFDLGTLVGVEHETSRDQMQLSVQRVTLPFIWVPNSNEGTVSKVDTGTGRELARYRTGPNSQNGNPSRTTVDLHGNCWVGNRHTGTVVEIGLLENGQYMDRNYDGVIETSADLNGDGQITGDELLPWASDECVIYEVVLLPGNEGTYIPGQYQGTYAADDSTPGPRGIAVDTANNIWAGCYGTRTYYYVSGDTGQILHKVDVSSVNHTPYGAVIDENGILWSSGQDKNHVLRLDPADFSYRTIGLGHFVYGVGIDGMGHLFVSGWDNSKLSCIDVTTGSVLWTKPGGSSSRGVACTDDGDVWVADSGSGLVSRYDNQGNLKKQIGVGNTPTGVSVDAAGKVWVVCFDNGYIFRIDPNTNEVDLTKVLAGTQHYGYSDMTGIVSRTYTAHIGSWNVLHFAGTSPSTLGSVSWIADEPPGAFLDVFVRSSNDRSQWSSWELICNGRAPRRTPPGRYYEIKAAFEGSADGASPVLYELTVTPAQRTGG
jgi:hypothetical protein